MRVRGAEPVAVLDPRRAGLFHQLAEGDSGLLERRRAADDGGTSFSGRFGHGGYSNTLVEQVLPVTCLPGIDDRVETPEGFNRIIPKKGADVLATIGDDENTPPFQPWARLRGPR